MRRLTAEEIASYDVVSAALARRIRIQPVPVLWPGTSAMTMGRLILIKRDDDRQCTSKLMAHELAHVGQYHRLGFWSFLRRYLADYLRNLRRLRNHRLAYMAIGLEVEARTEADQWADRRAEAQYS